MDVWLDDLRPNPYGWVWVKTVDETIEKLQTNEVEYLSLDNDLGESVPEGHEVVRWMVENNVWPETVLVHSANPVAVKYMSALIKGSGLYGDPRSVFVHYYPATQFTRLDNSK